MNKLNFELVPDGCWYSNLRSILSKKDWEMIRKDAINRANNRCSICGKKTDRLEAHERWSYNTKTATQKLEDVVAVCKDCHQTIHIGRTQLMGNAIKAEDHYMKVNNCSYSKLREDLGKANELQRERNKVSEWKLDLTYLKKYVGETNGNN